jgi:hypothetical protein
MSREEIRRYFDALAPVWDHWHGKNSYYHSRVQALVRGMIPPGKNVVEYGAGTGDLLASLKPARGIGLNVSEALTERARNKNPRLEFRTVAVDSWELPEGFKPDCVILTSMLDYVYDASDLFAALRRGLDREALVVVTTNNPLWAGLLAFAGRLGLRAPDSPRNFVTNKDIANVLKAEGFDIVEEGMRLPLPVGIPLLAPLINALIPEIPVLRFFCAAQYIAARPRAERHPLSCSVIIPCHNEEDNIAECVARIPKIGSKTEIVLVDDGSTDGTRKRATEIMKKDSRLRLIAADKNQGKAGAVQAGFGAASGDVVMILDADMTVLPEDLPKFFRPIQSGAADFVNGTRLVYPMAGRAMKIANFIGNKAFCFLVSWILRQRISDTLCGTKAMLKRDQAAMPQDLNERWGDFDLLFGAAKLKLGLLEVPIRYFERRAGQSKMRAFAESVIFLKACFKGWRRLRFPDSFPWQEPQAPSSVWKEIKA